MALHRTYGGMVTQEWPSYLAECARILVNHFDALVALAVKPKTLRQRLNGAISLQTRIVVLAIILMIIGVFIWIAIEQP